MYYTRIFERSRVYAELWTRGLRDPAYLPGRNLRGGWFHDILGSWSEKETQLWLRCYASDEDERSMRRSIPTNQCR